MNARSTRHDSQIEFETETSDMTNFKPEMSNTMDDINIIEDNAEDPQNGQAGDTTTHGYNL